MRNMSYIQPSIGRREEVTADDERTDLIDLRKKQIVTDLGQYKLNDYYFPLNSAASVLNEYRNYQRKKKEEGEL